MTLTGTTWGESAPPFVTSMGSVSCTSNTHCVATNGLVPIVESGTTWTNVALSPGNGYLGSTAYFATSCVPSRCVAVGGASIGINTSAFVASPVQPTFAGVAADPSNHGYVLAGANGSIWNYGDANYEGSLGDAALNAPVVGVAETLDGAGYWEVASDGGIFNFGDAKFYGSMGGVHINKPIVGIASTPDGGGYWEVASDGGTFSFGDAKFYGSTGQSI